MKDIGFKIGILMLGWLLFFTACSDPIIPDNDEREGGDAMIPLIISLHDASEPSTRTGIGTDYPNETDEKGSDWENAVQDVRVYIFDNTFTCEKIITSLSTPVMVKTGYKNLIAVVNGVVNNVPLPTTEATTIYGELRRLLSGVSQYVPTSPFLMTGDTLHVNLPEERDILSPYKVPISVERTCAKVTLKVMKSGDALSHNIVLQKIYMYKGANRVALLDTQNPNPLTIDNYCLSDTASVFNPSTGVVPNAGYGDCAMVDSFYTYESLCGGDKSKAVKIVVESYVNSPTNIRKAEFYLAQYTPNDPSPSDTTYNVKRNYWYDVTVDIKKAGLDSICVTMKVCPWNVADTIKDIIGHGAEITTAVPLKLVKNMTAAEMTAYPKYAKITKHSKGASWIEVKATPGSNWVLNAKNITSEDIERNDGVKAFLDNGGDPTSSDWISLPLAGIGTGNPQRVYIYRPYKEDNEPKLGPSLYVTLEGVHKQDIIIQPRDTTPIPTNCYVLRPQLSGAPKNETHAYIPLAGVYKYWEDELLDPFGAATLLFPSGNNYTGDTIPAGTITAVVNWDDVPTGAVVSNVQVIHPDKRDSAYILVEAGVPGNAVVTMNVAGNVFWCFHIWVTEYNPYEAAGQKFGNTVTTNIKNVFMDRNLGALSNVYDAEGNARGLYYQYGVQHPLSRTMEWDNATNSGNPPYRILMYEHPSESQISAFYRLIEGRSAPQAPYRPKNIIISSLSHARFFLDAHSSFNDEWPLTWDSKYIWDTPRGNKTALDPCPEGWRIPQDTVGTENSSPFGGNLFALSNLTTDNINGKGIYHKDLGYFPLSGIRTYMTSALNPSSVYWRTQFVGTHTFLWTSFSDRTEVFPDKGTGIEYWWDTGGLDRGYPVLSKRLGYSVRCVVDKKYLKSKENGGIFGSEAVRLKSLLSP